MSQNTPRRLTSISGVVNSYGWTTRGSPSLCVRLLPGEKMCGKIGTGDDRFAVVRRKPVLLYFEGIWQLVCIGEGVIALS